VRAACVLEQKSVSKLALHVRTTCFSARARTHHAPLVLRGILCTKLACWVRAHACIVCCMRRAGFAARARARNAHAVRACSSRCLLPTEPDLNPNPKLQTRAPLGVSCQPARFEARAASKSCKSCQLSLVVNFRGQNSVRSRHSYPWPLSWPNSRKMKNTFIFPSRGGV
jgi:hypothetical protein